MIFESVYAEGKLHEMAQELLERFESENLWLFKGEVGAGKTTLIKALVSAMGLDDEVTSPTFGLVNTYGGGAKQVHHFDLYRVESIDELEEVGFGSYIEQGTCFIEWPEILAESITPPFVLIEIKKVTATQRKLKATIILD